jgi:hypothetical protein
MTVTPNCKPSTRKIFAACAAVVLSAWAVRDHNQRFCLEAWSAAGVAAGS